MKQTNETLQDIISSLQGSCKSLDEELEAYNLTSKDLDLSDLKFIDESIFNCDSCGWWFEIGDDVDYNGEIICYQCFSEIEETENET